MAPGETDAQIKFTFSKFADSIKIFSAESDIKNVNKDFFNVLVLLPSDKVKFPLNLESRRQNQIKSFIPWIKL